MKGASTAPLAVKALVITGGEDNGAAIVMTSTLLLLPAELAAVNVTYDNPAAKGAPLITAPERLKPAGKAEALKLTGVWPEADRE